jgi:hypothetical protein
VLARAARARARPWPTPPLSRSRPRAAWLRALSLRPRAPSRSLALPPSICPQEKKPHDLLDALAPEDEQGERLNALAAAQVGKLKEAVSEKWSSWFGNRGGEKSGGDEEYTAEQVLSDLRAEREAATPAAPPPPRTYGPLA